RRAPGGGGTVRTGTPIRGGTGRTDPRVAVRRPCAGAVAPGRMGGRGRGASRRARPAAVGGRRPPRGGGPVPALEDGLAPGPGRRGGGEEAASAAAEAVRVLEPLGPGSELAWAYANVSAFHMETGHYLAAIDFGEKARALGEELGHTDVVSYALNTLGCAYVD